MVTSKVKSKVKVGPRPGAKKAQKKALHPLRVRREKAALSIPGLAKKAGVSRSGLFRWEVRSVEPRAGNIQRLAKALGVKTETLTEEILEWGGIEGKALRSRHPVRQLRDKAKLSQNELARRAKISKQSVVNWETGGGKPTMQSIEKLAKIFKVNKYKLYEAVEKWYVTD